MSTMTMTSNAIIVVTILPYYEQSIFTPHIVSYYMSHIGGFIQITCIPTLLERMYLVHYLIHFMWYNIILYRYIVC